jgi:hypothetical protein
LSHTGHVLATVPFRDSPFKDAARGGDHRRGFWRAGGIDRVAEIFLDKFDRKLR